MLGISLSYGPEFLLHLMKNGQEASNRSVGRHSLVRGEGSKNVFQCHLWVVMQRPAEKS